MPSSPPQKKKEKNKGGILCEREKPLKKKTSSHFQKLNLQQKEGDLVEMKEVDRAFSQG